MFKKLKQKIELDSPNSKPSLSVKQADKERLPQDEPIEEERKDGHHRTYSNSSIGSGFKTEDQVLSIPSNSLSDEKYITAESASTTSSENLAAQVLDLGKPSIADSETEDLRVKLVRAHSVNRTMEGQLASQSEVIMALRKELAQLRFDIENNSKKEIEEILTISSNESDLRHELSESLKKLTTAQTQLRTQTNLNQEKQSLLEVTEKNLAIVIQEKNDIEADLKRKVKDLTAHNDLLKTSLDQEVKNTSLLKDQIDKMKGETVEKQLDDEKQISELHEQLSAVKGEMRLLEKNKKKEIEGLEKLLANKETELLNLNSKLLHDQQQHTESMKQLTDRLTEEQQSHMQTKKFLDEMQMKFQALQSKMSLSNKEMDDLLLRNADLSSALEKLKIESKQKTMIAEEQQVMLKEKLQATENSENDMRIKMDTLTESNTKLQQQLNETQRLDEEKFHMEKMNNELHTKMAELEQSMNEKNKTIKMQQQTINDLKKTLRKEFKGQTDVAPEEESGTSSAIKPPATATLEKVKSSPALYDLDKQDRYEAQSLTSSLLNNGTNLLQYKHEVSGFCGHKDINFEYLKNVVFSFLISRDTESIHLVKAIAVLLEFTQAEEKLLRETLEWKMSWWPSTKPRRKMK